MATQDIGGLLFGQGGSGLGDFLTAEQQKQMQQQGMLSAAAALLSASGTRPAGQGIGFGQAIGGALQAGQQGYQQAQQGAVQNLIVRQKLDEAKRLGDYRKALLADSGLPVEKAPTTPMTPDQALIAGGLPVGPTVSRANLIGTPVPLPVEPKSQQDVMYQDLMRNYTLARKYGMTQEAASYLDQAQKIKPLEKVTGQPQEYKDEKGNPVLVQQFDSGRLQTVGGYGPKRDVVLQTLGGRTVAIDKSTLKGGESYAQTLAPQVVGGAETGYYVVGGGGGGAAPAPAGGGQPPAKPPLGSTVMRPDYRPAPSGQVIPPSSAAPTAGGPVPIIAGTGPKPPEQYNKMAMGILQTNNAINTFVTRLEGFGASDMFDPARRAELNSAHSNAMLQAKELYGLGVLNAGDEVILNKLLANPVDFTSSLTPISAIKKQADDLQAVINGANKNLSTVFKQPELVIPKPPEKPAALQEGLTSTSRSGKPIIVRNGKWEYLK